MAYLTAANVDVTLNPEDVDRSPDGRIGIRTFPTVAYGNGVLQYPAGGIPMPALGKFGFNFAIKRVYIEQAADGYIRSFVRATHKLRIFLGAARDAILVANHVGLTPTGNVAAPANHVGVAPTGNVAAPANHVGVAPTGNVAAPANHIDLAIAAPANHSHDLIIADGTVVDAVGANGASLVMAANGPVTVVGGNAANGGVADGAVPAPANMANLVHSEPAFTGDVPANFTHDAPVFTGDAPANFVHSAPAFTGDQMANLVHSVTGGGAVAEAALAEMDDGVAPASTVLYMEMVGK